MFLSALKNLFGKAQPQNQDEAALNKNLPQNNLGTTGTRQAAQQAFDAQPTDNAKKIPQMRPLHNAEKQAGIIYKVTKFFQSIFFKHFTAEEAKKEDASSMEQPLRSVKNAMDFMGGNALNV